MEQIKIVKPKNAIIYLRVSTEEQVENFSLTTQEEICRKEAMRKGYAIIEVFKEEGRSAKTITGRPVLVQMIEYCRKNKKNISAIFVYRLDRISRQTSDYLAIRKKLAENDILLLSATEPTGNSPTEKLVETMLAGFAQLDNDVRSERSKNGLHARFKSGLSIGGVPIGYVKQNGYVVKDSEQFDKIKEAWCLMATGTKSLREMANIMTEWGIHDPHNKEGSILRNQTIQRMFRNKFYLGILTSRLYPEEIRGQHPQMITEEQFYKVQAILDGRNTNLAVPIDIKSKDNTDFPLRRIFVCGNCGTPFTGAWSKGKHNRYAYYFCRNRCGAPSVPKFELESEFNDYLDQITPTSACLKLFSYVLRKSYMKRISALQRRRSDADEELTRLHSLKQTFIEKNLQGVYSDETFTEQNKLLEDKITAAYAAKNEQVFKTYTLEHIIQSFTDRFQNLGRTYQNATLTEKRILLCSIFAQNVSWHYPGISNTTFTPMYQCILNFSNELAAPSEDAGARTQNQ